MRELLTAEGLPQPDEVEHREASVVLLWHETKLAVVIDLEDDDGRPRRRDRPSEEQRLEPGTRPSARPP